MPLRLPSIPVRGHVADLASGPRGETYLRVPAILPGRLLHIHRTPVSAWRSDIAYLGISHLSAHQPFLIPRALVPQSPGLGPYRVLACQSKQVTLISPRTTHLFKDGQTEAQRSFLTPSSLEHYFSPSNLGHYLCLVSLFPPPKKEMLIPSLVIYKTVYPFPHLSLIPALLPHHPTLGPGPQNSPLILCL